MTGWIPDILGEGFEQCTLTCKPDSEGDVVATLVRALPEQLSSWGQFKRWLTDDRPAYEGVDVLYVHGWSDYFFQTELARFWAEKGANFYALDLRKYGRSLREWQTPGYIEDLGDYDEEIALALDVIRADGRGERDTPRKLLLLGHSTGGLVLSLWAHRHPGVATGVILNSPWLEFQLSGTVRKLLLPIIEVSARFNAHDAAPQIDLGFYSRAQQEVADPAHPIMINEAWRPTQSLPVRSGWMRAIMEGHDQISHGLHIDAPVCVMLSDRFVLPTRWSDDLLAADSVINVTEVARAALHLGPSVTIERIEGALHDIFLSAKQPRTDAYGRMERWTTGLLAAQHRPSMP